MKLVLLVILTALSACSDTQFGANFGFGAQGMTVQPTLSGSLGGAQVTISG